MEPLPALPPTLASTRVALHRLAAYVIAPTRHASTGRFGLRSTSGGFGTPEFDGRRVRVEGVDLVDEGPDGERRAPITSLAAAAAFLQSTVDPETAAEHDSPEVGDPEADLEIDAAASAYLGAWFAMAFEGLQQVTADAASVDGSEPQLWPGHFDPAIEVGDEDHRASYGASPGDHTIDEPYLYVAAWYPDRLEADFEDPYWNAPNFSGRMLRATDFAPDRDPVAIAVEFWSDARTRLNP